MFLRTNRLPVLTVVLTVISIILGCSGSGPTIPENAPQDSAVTGAVIPEGSSHGLAGYYLLSFDTETREIDAIPLRAAALHLNMVGVLNSMMGISIAGVPSEHDPPNGIFVFDITLSHPFESKPQFAGFDVKGILIGNGSEVVDGLNFAGLDETRLLNADGYTRWWNPTEFTRPGVLGFTEGTYAVPGNAFTATCNSYKLFADRLGAQDGLAWVTDEPLDSEVGRAVFKAGESNTRRYRIKFEMSPGPQIYFGYAVDCSWAMPDPNPPGEVPDDFPMEANQPEPYRIAVADHVNTLYFDSESGIGGGTIDIKANVHDWQGQDSGHFDDEISAVSLYSPELGIDNEPFNWIEQDSYKAKYRRFFDDLAPTATGQIQLFCCALSSDGSTYKQAGAPAPEEPLRAWQTLVLDVVDPPCEADSNNSRGEAVELVDQEPVTGALCGGTDNADYYTFTVPFGHQFLGAVVVHCSIPNTTFELTDLEENVIESGPIDGWTWIADSGELTGDTYYVKIETTQPDMAGLYAIEPFLDTELIVPDYVVDVTPESLSMDARWVHVMGDWLFMANHDFAWVWDISDEYNPQFLSRVRIDSTADPAFWYPYMYFVDYDGVEWSTIRMIDFTDVSNPVLNNFLWKTNIEIARVHADWNTLYFATLDGTDWGVTLWDYEADPLAPAYINSLDIADSALRDMAVMFAGTDNESLVLLQHDGLYAYNVSDPMNPYYVDSVSTTPPLTYNHSMGISGQYIAKINYSTLITGYNLVLYRYTNGQSIDVQSSVNLPDGYSPSVADAYGTWVIVGGTSGVNRLNRVYDFSEPASIEYHDMFQTRSRCNALHHDQYTLVAMQEYYSPRFTDITGFVAPGIWRESMQGLNYPSDSVLLGDYMYLTGNHGTAHHTSGINLESAPDAYLRSTHSSGYQLDFLCGNENILAWTRNSDQLYFACPDEGAFSDGSSFHLPQDVASIAVSDEYMYVVMKNPSVMKVYNHSLFPDSDPTELPDVSVSPAVQNLIVQGDAMYGFDLDTMFIYTLAVPEAPAQAGTYVGSAAEIRDRLIFGDWMFLLYSSELAVLDISDPLNPVFETSITLPHGDMHSITRMEQYVIAGNTDQQPVFVDITDPTSPGIFGSPITDDVTWSIRGLDSGGRYLYELCDSYGVRIYEVF